MCEIGAESRWMLRNVSEMVDAFEKETLTENGWRNVLKYQLFVWIGRTTWTRFQLVDSMYGLKSKTGVLHH